MLGGVVSRSGYSDECEHVWLWMGAVKRALHGKRGQAFLREIVAALDALPNKRLIRDELVNEAGECCAIGAVAIYRGLDTSELGYHDPSDVGEAFGIASSMAAEIEFRNDEDFDNVTPERRFELMRAWVVEQIVPTADELDKEPGK